jgi:predicted Zn-dependent peptidase
VSLSSQSQFSHTFSNGLVLLGEQMEWLESAAFAILLPAGCVHDPPDRLGLSNFTCDMMQRGCGGRDSRQFVEALERLGVDRSAAVSGAHTSFGASTLAENLLDALSIYADMIRQPRLPDEHLEDARQVCLQELSAIEDDLAYKTMQRLRFRFYGQPWGRSPQGEPVGIEAIAKADVWQHFQANYHARGTIISVAGRIDWPRLVDHVDRLLGSWPARETPDLTEQPGLRDYEHIPFESSQTQICIAFPTVPYRDPNYFQARGAVGVLSDGMSSRLFTEVREKRGLCYTVYATCHSLRDRAGVLAYSGTSTDRAQETLNVLLAELSRLSQGIQADELGRLKARIKSSLIMQQESSAARASAMAGDWYHLGRVLTMAELGGIIDGLSCDSINAFLTANPPRDFTIVTLGEKELEVPIVVS